MDRFVEACQTGDLELAKKIYGSHGNTPIMSYYYDEGLCIACKHGHIDVVVWLVTSFGDCPLQDRYKPLYNACAKGHLDVINILDHEPNKDVFVVACANNHRHVVKYLIRHFDLPDVKCVNDMYVAACSSGHLHIAKWIARIFSLQDINEKIYTKIFNNAVNMGCLRALKWLIRNNRVAITCHQAKHKFDVACERGHLAVAKMILHMFPKIKITNEHMDNVHNLDVAIWLHSRLGGNCIYPVCLLACENKPKLVKWFLDNYQFTRVQRNNMLIRACMHDNLNVAIMLVTKYPRLKKHDRHALFVSVCIKCSIELVQWFIETFDIDVRGKHDEAFREACIFGNIKVAEYLITQYQDIDPSVGQYSVFYLACYHRHVVVVKFLYDMFPDINIYSSKFEYFTHNSNIHSRLFLQHASRNNGTTYHICDECIYIMCAWPLECAYGAHMEYNGKHIYIYNHTRGKWRQTIITDIESRQRKSRIKSARS